MKLSWTGRQALLALVVAALAAVPASAEDSGKLRVLLIDGQNNHNWRATTPHLKKVLEACGRFTVDVATSPEKPKLPPPPKNATDDQTAAYRKAVADATAKYQAAMAGFHPPLGKYDVIVSNYNGDLWPETVRKELDELVKNGKVGLVIVHAANNSFPQWTEYNQMIGMGWRGNSFGDRLIVDDSGKEVRVPKGQGPGAGHGPQHEFQVTLRDPEHPIVRGMPPEWKHCRDELYQGMRGPIQNVHLIATSFSSKAQRGTGEHEPMIWTVSYGKGKVFHTPMGHDLTGMRCVGFVATLQRGTEWAATGKVTLPLPDKFPTAEKSLSLPE